VKEKRKEELLDMLVFRLLRRRTIQSVKYPYIKGRWVEEIYTDVGPGLNDRRRSFKRILKRVVKKDISRIIISHPDRLTLLGFVCSRR
jgi:putative resolvase